VLYSLCMDTNATTNESSTMQQFPGIFCESFGTMTAGVVAFGANLNTARYAGIMDSGDTFSTYRQAIFGCGPIKSVAVEVKITGKVVKHTYGPHGIQGYQRGQITYVGDGEPDTTAKCWVRVR